MRTSSATAALLGLALLGAPSRALALEVAGPAPAPPAAVAIPPEPHRHSESDPLASVAVGALVGLVLADVGFGIYDSHMVANGRLPARGPAIAEAAVAAPQVVLFQTMHVVVSADGNGGGSHIAGLVFLPGVANSLFLHGVWASQQTAVRPGVLYGLPAAAGFDTALTGSALARAATGHWSGRAMGITQMVLTAPQIAASSYGIAKDATNARAWAALTAWSGALFAHGLVSTIVGEQDDPVPVHSPPPPPVAKPPLLVPASLEVGPAPMAGGGGIVVSGRWL